MRVVAIAFQHLILAAASRWCVVTSVSLFLNFPFLLWRLIPNIATRMVQVCLSRVTILIAVVHPDDERLLVVHFSKVVTGNDDML